MYTNTNSTLEVAGVRPAWLRLMRYCAELGHGEIERLKIQDGLPMVAEVTTERLNSVRSRK